MHTKKNLPVLANYLAQWSAKSFVALSSIWLGLSVAYAKSPYEAARQGDLEVLRQQRFEGIDLFIPDERGFIPYELAALHANPEKPKVLQRHVETMLWLKEYQAQKHRYGKAANTLVQAGLNALGYDAGKPDGILGENTGNAIRDYQRDNELAETGRLGPQWLGMFYQDSLKDLQYKLTKLGYNTYGTDGLMGAKTRNAMLKYRHDKGLSAPDYPYLDGLLLASVDTDFSTQEKHKKIAIAEKARQKSLSQTRYAQAGLRALGHRVGQIDGKMGSKTANAIKAFQKKNRLTVNGELDNQTLQTMRSRFLKNTQKKLNRIGYSVGQPDGKLGKRTIAALRKYRTQKGLSERGGVDSDLLTGLHSEYVAAENQRKAAEAETKRTKDSQRIRFAQAGLRTLGHRVDIDGLVGSNTTTAIKSFQKRYRLKRTGKADTATYAKMKTIFLKETQRKLNILGYKAGSPDGQMGKRTQTAIKNFRRKQKLFGNGLTADLIAAVDDNYDNHASRRASQKSQGTTASAKSTNKKSSKSKKQAQSTASSSKKTASKPRIVSTSKPKKTSSRKTVKTSRKPSRVSGRSAKGRMKFSRKSGRVIGCNVAGRNIPIEWCEPFYPLPRNNHCEATFKPSSGAVINLWCK